jgi:hypothetical protein
MDTKTKMMRTSLMIAMTATACGDADPTILSGGGGDDPETETYRQALPAAEDVELSYGDDGEGTTLRQALNGDPSEIALLTRDAVVGTNTMMKDHFDMMKHVASQPPTDILPNGRVWQAVHGGVTIRVVATSSPTPRGIKYDYLVAGKRTGSVDDFLPIIDGHVVRLADRYEPRDGFGVVRFRAGNLNTLQPVRNIGGIARVAFRKANRAHQVNVRAIGLRGPNSQDFPIAAQYAYAVAPSRAGRLVWFSHGNVANDGAPFENAAVHSAWRPDHSGIGAAFVTGGTLGQAFIHEVECWDTALLTGFEVIETPWDRQVSGDPANCKLDPDAIEPPAIEDVPDEDPMIPEPMPEEDGN